MSTQQTLGITPAAQTSHATAQTSNATATLLAGLQQLVIEIGTNTVSREEITSMIAEQTANAPGITAEQFEAVISSIGEELETKFAAIEKQIAENTGSRTVVITPTATVEIEERTHHQFEYALRIVSTLRKLWLYGEAGTGKTHLAQNVAQAMQLNFGSISCSLGMSVSQITGKMDATGTFHSTDFLNAYENGGVFLFDEFDRADANVLTVLNSAFANGFISVPNRTGNPVARRHADFIPVIATNTLGRKSAEYTAAQNLDRSTVDRFLTAAVEMQYDTELEKSFFPISPLMTASQNAGNMEIYTMIAKARETVKTEFIKQTVSTRMFIDAAKLHAAGFTKDEIREQLFRTWSEDERKRIK